MLEDAENKAGDLSDRMPAPVAARLGRDSNEYEQAGGKRKSDHKRVMRAATTAPVVAKAA